VIDSWCEYLKRARLGLLVCFSLLISCGEPPLHKAEFYVFGTLVEVSLSGVEESRADQAFSLLQERFQAMHRDWHAWEPGKLANINERFARGMAAEADAELVQLLGFSQKAEILTGGRFNPAIGKLIGLWGFHTSDFPVTGPSPSAVDIAALVALHPSSLDIEIRAGQLHSSNRAVQLDFGAIAKGFAVDIAREALAGLGVHDAIVNAGGDLRAFGSRGTRPWRVAIRNPLGGALGVLEINQDEAVFTSGNYERYRETENHDRFPHILDPRTGWPARQVMSATVVANEGWLADAAATALVVAGLSEWNEVTDAMELDLVLIVDEAGQIHATPAMLDRLLLSETQKPAITLRRQ